jgi:hypothetical protein
MKWEVTMKRILFISGVVLFLTTNIVNAEPINYTFTGTASGNVNGAAFSNADVTITAFADTGNVLFDGYNLYQVIPSSTTVDIAGVGSGTLTGEVVVFNMQAFNYSFAGLQQDAMDIVTVESLDLETYDLKTSFGPLSPGYLSLYGSLNIPTTMGTVVFNSAGDFVFQAEVQNIDSDNDGVLDAVDACDNTPSGEVVDEEGCPIAELGSSVSAEIEFRPRTLNKKSRDRWVGAYIELPQGYDVKEIDRSSILLGGSIPARSRHYRIGDHDRDGIPELIVKFKRRDVITILPEGDEVPVTVSGFVGTTTFEGKDVIRVISGHHWKHYKSRKRCKSDHSRKGEDD